MGGEVKFTFEEDTVEICKSNHTLTKKQFICQYVLARAHRVTEGFDAPGAAKIGADAYETINKLCQQ